jgi:hypothetical protein
MPGRPIGNQSKHQKSNCRPQFFCLALQLESWTTIWCLQGVGITIMPAKRGGDLAAHWPAGRRKGLFEIFMDADVHSASLGVTPPLGMALTNCAISLCLMPHPLHNFNSCCSYIPVNMLLNLGILFQLNPLYSSNQHQLMWLLEIP